MAAQAAPTSPAAAQTPSSCDMSPGVVPQADHQPQNTLSSPEPSDYFSVKRGQTKIQIVEATKPRKDANESPDVQEIFSSDNSSDTASPGAHLRGSRETSPSEGERGDLRRKSPYASVTFRQPRDPNLPQGHARKTDGNRLRRSSPEPIKFRPHISFDNLPAGEATKNNAVSFTLNARHQGYHPRKLSRTFMAGVDENAYSDYALVWLIENLVEDGDEIVCVHVIENPSRGAERVYRETAKKMLQNIQTKNTNQKAISIVLEYAIGKLHTTFQHFIQLYQPSMLIVGTRGRSLGGIQGLMNSRNSFSKYCLQYSPVPVVVVRPNEARKKKKEKRRDDPGRHTYLSMLVSTHGKHEADSDASSLSGFDLEKNISADEEAHQVAAALGLPAAFDPTIKPYIPEGHHGRSSLSGLGLTSTSSSSRNEGFRSPHPSACDQSAQASENESELEESGDEGEGDFEVKSGDSVLKRQAKTEAEELEIERKKRSKLHAMEVGEAAALLKSGAGKGRDEEEDEDEEGPGSARSGGARVAR